MRAARSRTTRCSRASAPHAARTLSSCRTTRSSLPAARIGRAPRSRRACRRASIGSPRSAWRPRSRPPIEQLVAGELAFLEALRIALRIAPLEAEQIINAARARPARARISTIATCAIKSMIPVAAEVFALRALARGDGHRRAALQGPRLLRRDSRSRADAPTSSTPSCTARFAGRAQPDAQVFGELARVAQPLPDPVDRYWMVVYTLVAELPATVPSWRVIPFMGVMQAAFQIVDTDMELAVIDALTFPASLPRPADRDRSVQRRRRALSTARCADVSARDVVDEFRGLFFRCVRA